MTALHAPSALLPEGWAEDVRVTLDGGRIAGVEPGAAAEPGDLRLTGARSCRRCRTCTATRSSAPWPA